MIRTSTLLFIYLFICATPIYAQDICRRTISLAPSITESLHELGLLNFVVGRTKYDTYPSEVSSISIVGGFLDPSLETIISLKPTLVVGLAEQKEFIDSLNKLKIRTQIVEHRSVDGILKSFETLGALCGAAEFGTSAVAKINNSLQKARLITSHLPKKKVVVVVSRSYESPELKDVYLSGSDGYYNTLIEYAGGVNVFKQMTGAMTGTSLEGLYSLDPDDIIEVLPQGEISKLSLDRLMRPWNKLTLLRSVREGRVYLIDDDWATVPGPRLTLLLDTLVKILHPELHK